MTKRRTLTSMIAVALSALAGCAPGDDQGIGSENTIEAQVALSTVPTGVQCVRVAVTIGSTTTTAPLVTVVPGASSANLTVGQLASGAATFNGAAFNIACSSVTGGTVANWLAVPAMTTLALGTMNKVTL